MPLSFYPLMGQRFCWMGLSAGDRVDECNKLLAVIKFYKKAVGRLGAFKNVLGAGRMTDLVGVAASRSAVYGPWKWTEPSFHFATMAEATGLPSTVAEAAGLPSTVAEVTGLHQPWLRPSHQLWLRLLGFINCGWGLPSTVAEVTGLHQLWLRLLASHQLWLRLLGLLHFMSPWLFYSSNAQPCITRWIFCPRFWIHIPKWLHPWALE